MSNSYMKQNSNSNIFKHSVRGSFLNQKEIKNRNTNERCTAEPRKAAAVTTSVILRKIKNEIYIWKKLS